MTKLKGKITIVSKVGKTKAVGDEDPKMVTPFNNKLYLEAVDILEDATPANRGHIGWKGVGIYIDYLEANYDITPKGNK